MFFAWYINSQGCKQHPTPPKIEIVELSRCIYGMCNSLLIGRREPDD